MTSTDNKESRSDLAVVALGGGHGLACTLKSARRYAGRITAVVSLGDDGGSSGMLREDYAVAPPGDIRRCLSALAHEDSFLGRHLEHRVSDGGLEGHPVGNLLLAGLTLASHDFEASVAEVARLVGAVGVVYPATKVPVTLVAETDDGVVSSQVAIDEAEGIRKLRFLPDDPPVPVSVNEAIAEADQVVLGPGSFFTSVLAAASLPAIRRSLGATEAQCVLVANMSDSLTGTPVVVSSHLNALAEHGLKIDAVLADTSLDVSEIDDVAVVQTELADSTGLVHDPGLLAGALSDMYWSGR